MNNFNSQLLTVDGSIKDLYRNFIALSRYARWAPENQRRETWKETVRRLMDFWRDRTVGIGILEDLNKIEIAILNHEIVPSMRTLMSSGKALDRDNVAGFNCSYKAVHGRGKRLSIDIPELEEPIEIHVKKVVDFDELMYILLCGTGAGFSCERQNIVNLPTIGKKLDRLIYRRTKQNYPGVQKEELSSYSRIDNTILVEDSKYGWASSLRILVIELFNGNFEIKWNLSKIRSAGSPLKTFGGRSSGPGPLNELFEYFVDVFKKANGRKLSSLEVHGLICKIGTVVVSGGVRRSALISLSNLSDDRMRHAKTGQWWNTNPEYGLANNSAVYAEKPSCEIFMREWVSLIESKSGERGIFNRLASTNQAEKNGRRGKIRFNGSLTIERNDKVAITTSTGISKRCKISEIVVGDTIFYDKKNDGGVEVKTIENVHPEYGCNPCSEIILRDSQFCNLSEVIIRPEDSFDDLKEKVRLATIIGTLQADLTNFVYLQPEWKHNTEEEALLGVSFTGIMDHSVMNNSTPFFIGDTPIYLSDVLDELKEISIKTNAYFADKLGINRAAAITCVKPSGTVSQLVDSASGIHPRYSPYYIRTVRQPKNDPISKLMVDCGFLVEDDVTNSSNYVFSFPIKAPKNSVFRDDRSAIEQLELWLIYQRYWCEHKPSITIYVKEDEWFDVGAWVHRHFDEISGVSFLPYSDHTYRQAPYQEIDEKRYFELLKSMPTDVDWSLLGKYELEDNTTGMQEYACTGGSCELI
jgi:ribonucleoside-triphosphate reductase (thioredoxin)